MPRLGALVVAVRFLGALLATALSLGVLSGAACFLGTFVVAVRFLGALLATALSLGVLSGAACFLGTFVVAVRFLGTLLAAALSLGALLAAARLLGALLAAAPFVRAVALPARLAGRRPSARTSGELLFFLMAARSSGLRAACSALRRASSRSTSTPPFLLAGFLRQLPCSFGRLPGTGS
ncbi:hypothetical protein WME94_16400 [Sorangium sp. So ce429]